THRWGRRVHGPAAHCDGRHPSISNEPPRIVVAKLTLMTVSSLSASWLAPQLAGEALVDHRAVAALEVQLDDDARRSPTRGVDDDRVLRLVREAEDVTRIDAERLLRRDRHVLRRRERAVGELVPREVEARGGHAPEDQRRRPTVRAAETPRH